MNNEELQHLRKLCGQPRLTKKSISHLNETQLCESDIKELAEHYRGMGISVTRAKLIELVEAKQANCPCCNGPKTDCVCEADCDCGSDEEECTDCEVVDVCDNCKKEVKDCKCEDED